MRRDGTATRGLSQICLVIVMKLSNVVGCHRDSRLEGIALITVLEWAGMPLNLAREKLKRQHMLCARDTFRRDQRLVTDVGVLACPSEEQSA